MKKVLGMLFISSLIILGCKKQAIPPEKCEVQTQITKNGHLIHYDFSSDAPNFIDTFNKYPQLQIYRLILEPELIGVHCNVFYQGLEIFDEGYRIFKNRNTGETFVMDSIRTFFNIELTPTMTHKEAIRIAESKVDYKGGCVSYQLGIYDMNRVKVNLPEDFKLVWKVTPTNGEYPMVMLDAHTGKTYYSYEE